jgi:hypothetical protein
MLRAAAAGNGDAWNSGLIKFKVIKLNAGIAIQSK